MLTGIRAYGGKGAARRPPAELAARLNDARLALLLHDWRRHGAGFDGRQRCPSEGDSSTRKSCSSASSSPSWRFRRALAAGAAGEARCARLPLSTDSSRSLQGRSRLRPDQPSRTAASRRFQPWQRGGTPRAAATPPATQMPPHLAARVVSQPRAAARYRVACRALLRRCRALPRAAATAARRRGSCLTQSQMPSSP